MQSGSTSPPNTGSGGSPRGSDTRALIDTIERLATPDFVGRATHHDELALAILPAGKSVVDLKPYLDALRDQPVRIAAAAKVTAVQSLIDYVNRFKLADSALFAADDPAKPSLTGIIDYHGGVKSPPPADNPDARMAFGDATPGSSATPRFGVHTVRYEFPISEQIAAWSGISGKPLPHDALASFLDERRYDIVNPPADWMQLAEADRPAVDLILHLLNIGNDQGELDDAAADPEQEEDGEDRYIPRSALYKLRQIRFGSVQRLLQLARTVEISVDRKAREGYDPKTGQRTVSFDEEHQTADKSGRRVVVPDFFLLDVPIFDGETPILVPVRLQYRHSGAAGFVWFLTLVEWRRVVRFAVRTEAARAAAATGLPLFYGAR